MPKRTLNLDEIDRDLLEELQTDAGRTLRELGDVVGLSPSAVQRRIEGYRSSGVLARQVAVLDTSLIPNMVMAVVLVTLERESPRHHAAFRKRLLAAPEVQQAYDVTGEWDYVVIITASGLPHYREVGERLFAEAPNVRKYTSMFVLSPERTGSFVPVREHPS
ncbi:DNA-binding Lrp family transcriptional regulator [Herbihabitans rhizosphaerae]|uniref:DNA-binding Lrp family transcriptional regulator n=1 Tax=Herbihabitans rhizosphaerae TaxID=1872711 RepID=A0A4Q7KIK2_9PSEU|nr:Lrp/AsnC family transcriptional regulator [Herbihabitans rhizosphaerae]RZS34758.1 DNA-binding Lrp family transcriptional regulator [Herbihabitans rhizosphaerae]